MRLLIIGAGYVGAACARHFRQLGFPVCCRTRTAASAAALAAEGFVTQHGDIAAARDLGFTPDTVLYCPSTRGGGPEEYRHIHIDGLARAWQLTPPGTRFLYTSSTSVYGQTDGSLVDENSPADPIADTGKILREAEKKVLDQGGIVLRLAGIYGPGRTVLLEKFLNGSAVLPPDPDHVLNLIHLDDIVRAVTHLAAVSTPTGVFNVTDQHPSSYREIYSWLAGKLNLPLPPRAGEDFLRKRGITNKRVSNLKLQGTGWLPSYPSFREGYAALLAP